MKKIDVIKKLSEHSPPINIEIIKIKQSKLGK
jgi:hypothetical protein